MFKRINFDGDNYYVLEKTATKTGLSVIVNLMHKVYAKGRKLADRFKENLPIIFDEYLPKCNYRAIPQLQTKCISYLFLIPDHSPQELVDYLAS